MPRISTSLINFARPGLWARVHRASADGGIAGLHDGESQLEQHGLHRDQSFVSTLYDWYEARVPVPTAFCLWYLRDAQQASGAITRSRAAPLIETNPVLRFLHLARLLGEDHHSDPAVASAAAWVLSVQLDDGSLPATPADQEGEMGTTARGARALHGLGGAFDDAAERMRDALAARARPASAGMSWGAGTGHRQRAAASGATALAGLALADGGARHTDLARAAGAWLIDSQGSDGGWAEVAGGRSTSHNTFNALRTLDALARKGLADPDVLVDVRASAATWVERRWDDLEEGRVMDLGFAVRLVALTHPGDPRGEGLVLRLAGRANEALDVGSDAYDTEVLGIAVLEWSRRADEVGVDAEWRWQLPRILPPFARSGGTDLYDVLYLLNRGDRWQGAVDHLVRSNLVEALGGRILGAVAALAIVDERTPQYLAGSGHAALAVALVVLVIGSTAAWATMRLLASSRRLRVVRTMATSAAMGWVVADMSFTSMGTGPVNPAIVRIAATMLAALVVDAVSYTADRSGFIGRFLPAD